jgi:hypothetical protein
MYFPYKDVEHKFFAAYQNVDMNWVAALHSMFNNPDANVGPVLFDTGACTLALPILMTLLVNWNMVTLVESKLPRKIRIIQFMLEV